MNKKMKVGLLIGVVLVLTAGLVAFRPYNGDADEDGIPDQNETLAEVMGIDVDTLTAAIQAAQEKAIEQAVADGKITQEQLDAMAEKEGMHDGHGNGFRGADMSTYLAEELGISVEELQAAQQETQDIILEKALEDGQISEEEYENIQLQQTMSPYFNEAFQTARENAIEQALEDGVITDAQAESLLSGGIPFGKGPGGVGHGMRGGPGGRMKPGNGFFPNPEESNGD